MKQNSGFTLIELSIVLVIIGLIVGGVLVGKDLIRAAQTRRIVSQLEKYNTAANTFKLKYNALPGDMPDAESIWGSDVSCPNGGDKTTPHSATCNGNGDGIITSAEPTTNDGLHEVSRFWQQLSDAELVDGQFTGIDPYGDGYSVVAGVNAPAFVLDGSAGNGAISVWYKYPNEAGLSGVLGAAFPNFPNATYPQLVGKHVFVLGIAPPGNLYTGAYSVFTPVQARQIDSKIDDGHATTGNMVGSNTCQCLDAAITDYSSADAFDKNAAGCGTTPAGACALITTAQF